MEKTMSESGVYFIVLSSSWKRAVMSSKASATAVFSLLGLPQSATALYSFEDHCLLTISFYPLISCISLTTWDDQILIACYVDIVCVTVWMPKNMVPDRNAGSWMLKQLVLIYKYESRWCHEFSSASFYQLSVFTPFMNKSSIRNIKHTQIYIYTSSIWRFLFSCSQWNQLSCLDEASDWRTWEPCHLRLIECSR